MCIRDRFQKIVGIAKERGLLAEDDETTEDEADEIVEMCIRDRHRLPLWLSLCSG